MVSDGGWIMSAMRERALDAMKACALLAATWLASAPCAWSQAAPVGAPIGAPIGVAQQVTRSYNFDMSPAPDNSRVLMVSVVGGHSQILVGSADGQHWDVITQGAANHEDPVWSPDGKSIAYVLSTATSRVVHLMNPDGSGDQALTPANVRAIHPSWTADGQGILYSTDDDLRPPAKNASDIFRLDLASGRIDTLITGGVNTFPVMSPDGTRIAFRRIVGDMNSEVFVANADGSEARNLTDHPSYEGWPAWSPDGQRIAFAANRNGQDHQIFVMGADGSGVRLLADTHGRGTSPKWSPDGRSIFFTNCLPQEGGGGCEIMVVLLEAAGQEGQ